MTAAPEPGGDPVRRNSQAARARIRYSRRDALARFLGTLRSHGHHVHAESVAAAIEAWDEHGGDPAEENCDAVGEVVAVALAELGHDRAAPENLEVCPVARQAISATARGYEDGSALALVSDSLVAFAMLYAQHLADARTKESALATARSVFRRYFRDESGLDEDLLAASLRFSALHQRVLGGPVTPFPVLTDRQQTDADWYLTHCLRFVVAHEYAHVLLGHGTAAPGVSSCAGDPGWETEADELALRTVLHAWRRHGPGTRLHAGLGALLAVVVVHFSERALFIHRGTTHPPATERLDRLVRSLPPHVALLVGQYGSTLMGLTDRAAHFGAGAAPVPWQPVLDHPRVRRQGIWLDHRDDLARYAEIQSHAPHELVAALREGDARHGTAVSAGAEAVLAGRTGDGLRLWGLPPRRVEEITDPALPLSFWGLLDEIHTTLPAVPHPAGRLDPALRAATLAQYALMEEIR
ncbi:hypothetical protein HTV45_10225 [Streptomyces sp. CHD11]|uniref:hypothetical protein n=1 Tax=Streptomyces sp. CHD11 TaxID=2741325 RepID=UPI001BFC10BA|nr:hypothetical protein [Streptomyces sp. CHD11]MBT3151254.1 hypothetical protein [Streptomyces sp. CHD11]